MGHAIGVLLPASSGDRDFSAKWWMPERVMSNVANACIRHQRVPGAVIEHVCLCLRCINQEGNLTKSGMEMGTTMVKLVKWTNGGSGTTSAGPGHYGTGL
jgi:hypothetical protein